MYKRQFYGHSVERDNADELTRCLLDAPVDLLCGSGIRQFTERGDGLDMEKELAKNYRFVRSIDRINDAKGKVVCICLLYTSPGPQSPRYTEPVRVDRSLTLRAKGFKAGAAPSHTLTLRAEKARFLPPAATEAATQGVRYTYYDCLLYTSYS